MARVKIKFPAKEPLFTTTIPVRVTDLNYGNHLGNDRILVMSQEARVQWLTSIGCSELAVGGCGLIMADAVIVYKNEGLYGHQLIISVFSNEVMDFSFDLYFNIQVKKSDKIQTIAEVKTRMVGFDYNLKKVVALPESLKNKL